MKHKMRLAALIAWSLTSLQIMAQDSGDTLLVRTLEELTIVSSRLPSGLLQSARTIYHQDLSRTNQSNQGLALDEALRYVPGVFSMDALNFSQDIRIAIRGFGSRAAFGVRGIKVLVDDIPATTPDGQTQLDHVNVQSMDDLEVLTGAVGGLYGNASGGAISLRRSLPVKNAIKISTTAGSFGLLRNEVQVDYLSGQWKVELDGNHLTFDGFRQNSGTKSLNLNSRLTYDRPKAQYQFMASFTDSPTADDAGGIDLESAMADRRQARAQNLSFKAGESILESTLALKTRQTIASNQSLDAKLYYIYRDFENLLPFRNGGAVAFKRDFSGANVQYTLELNNYRLLVGGETERQKDDRVRKNNENGTAESLVFDQQENFGMIGLYILQDIKIHPQLTLDLNARADFMKVSAKDHYLSDGDQSGEINWQHVSPSIGLNYKLGAGHYCFATAGHSFETPALSELSSSPDGGGGFNADLNPQLANHFETGLKGLIADWFYQVSLFHIDLKNELLPFELENFPGRTFYRNAGGSDRNGIELAFNGKPAKNLTILGGYTFSDFKFSNYEIDGEDLSGNRISGIPKNFGNLGIVFSQNHGLFLAADFIATGKLFANDANTTTVEGYNLVHVRAGWSVGMNKVHLKVHAGIRNLGDKEYFDNIRINAFGGRYYEPAPGRHYFGGLSLEF